MAEQETWWCPNGCGQSFTGVRAEVMAMISAHLRLSCPKSK